MAHKPTMLDIMRQADPEMTSSWSNYSRKVQRSDYRQPLLITTELADALLAHVKSEILRAQKEEDLDLLDELHIHQTTLENGMIYRGHFFFGPLTWDYTTDITNPHFPRLKTALENSSYYVVDPQSWSLNTYKHWQQTGRLKVAPHPWYTSFTDGIMPALFRSKTAKAISARPNAL